MQLNQKLGLDNFKFELRLAEGKHLEGQQRPPRWDEAYMKKELFNFGHGKITRVWVCGAPIMNQVFDQAFENLAPYLGLVASQIEIM